MQQTVTNISFVLRLKKDATLIDAIKSLRHRKLALSKTYVIESSRHRELASSKVRVIENSRHRKFASSKSRIEK